LYILVGIGRLDYKSGDLSRYRPGDGLLFISAAPGAAPAAGVRM
jgi:hypothetical protein